MKESMAKGIRLPLDMVKEIQRRADYKGWSFNRWVLWAVTQGLRSHKKGGKGED